jgi:hypothetical protein
LNRASQDAPFPQNTRHDLQAPRAALGNLERKGGDTQLIYFRVDKQTCDYSEGHVPELLLPTFPNVADYYSSIKYCFA